jgi:hypothetical protein
VGCYLFSYLVLELPYSLFGCELLLHQPDLWEDPHLKPTHREQQIRVILGVHRHKRLFPVNSGYTPGQPIFDFPEHTPP